MEPSTTANDGGEPKLREEALISTELRALHDLALRGSWRTILENLETSKSRSQSNLIYPHEHLIQLTLNAIALSKLRRYSDAFELIQASVEDLDGQSYRFEAYPNLYPNRTGSMVPFSLRWLHAHLPSLLGRRAESLDRLYLLLHFVRNRIDHHSDHSSTAAATWRKREEFVVSTIVSYHSNQKEFAVCLAILKDIIKKNGANLTLLSKYGAVQLQFGDLDGAKSTFQRVETLAMQEKGKELGDVGIDVKNMIGRNKALVYMVGKDYVSAVREYDECIERDNSDVVAINNKALCLMYLRDLSDSIKVLENSLERVPTVAINETLIVNLCSMYELAYVNHSDIKKTLSNWIVRLAPDDFDSSCTRV